MSISKLMGVAPPPDDPVDTGTYDKWNLVEAHLGAGLPTDYKHLVNRYGSGRFGDYVYVLNPFGTGDFRGYRNLLNVQEELLDNYRTSQIAAPGAHPPYPAYPPLGGLLPWATGDNAEMLCWLTDGEPDSWPTICLDEHWTDDTERFDLDASDFLASWLTGSIQVKSLSPARSPASHPGALFERYDPALPPGKW